MQLLIALSALFVTGLAAPGGAPPRKQQCPTNKFQPNGKLPPTAHAPKDIIQVSAKHSNKAYPSSRYYKVTPNDSCTISVVEVPYTPGSKCALIFDFPTKKQASGDFWNLSGPGDFTFTPLSAIPIPGETT